MAQTRNRRSGVEDRWHRGGDGTPCTDKAHGKLGTLTQSANHGTGMRWRARYVDDDGREHSKGFTRKTDAQKWLDDVTATIVVGTYVDPKLGKVTFSSFYKTWSKRQVWETGTRHTMDLSAACVTFGDVPLGELTKADLESWVKQMQRDGLAPTTIKTRFANVHSAIRVAATDRPRFMGTDVAAGVKLPAARKAAAAMDIPAATQVGAAIAACETIEPWFAAYIAVCAFAGLRRGEASALKVSDVDFMRRELQVQRQVQWNDDGTKEIRPPKYGSERTVFAPDDLLTMLSEHIRLYRPGDDPDRWLFPGSRNAELPAHSATVNRWWRIVRAHIGIDNRLHDLRHFYASGLISAGCDVVTVQRAMGHSTASVTLDTYGHLWPDASDRTRTAAAGLIKQAFNPPADALRTETEKTASD